MQKVSLGNIIGKDGVFIDGDWVESKDQDPSGEVRLIQLADIGEGKFLDKSNRYLTRRKAEELKCTFLKAGDVLIARMPDPIGRACIFPELNYPCVTVVDVCIVRPDSKQANNVWLKLFINSSVFRQEINKYITGTTRKRISRGNLAKIKFSLPSLEDQQRIAAILSEIEVLAKQRKESIALADEFLEHKFLELFGDPVRNEKEFRQVRLGNVCSKIGSGATPKGGKENYKRTGISLIRSMNVYNNEFDYQDLAFIDDDQASLLGNVIVEENDVLLNITGASVARSCIVPNDVLPARVNQHVSIIRPQKEILNPVFLSRTFTSLNFQKLLIRNAKKKGATREAITKEEIESIFVSIPSIDLQNLFEKIVEQVGILKRNYIESLDELKELFASLSQRALKGDLDIAKVPLTKTYDLIEGKEAGKGSSVPQPEEVIPESKIDIVGSIVKKEKPSTSQTIKGVVKVLGYDPAYEDIFPFINEYFKDRYFTFTDLKKAALEAEWKYDFEKLKSFVFELLRQNKLKQIFADATFKSQYTNVHPDFDKIKDMEEKIFLQRVIN